MEWKISWGGTEKKRVVAKEAQERMSQERFLRPWRERISAECQRSIASSAMFSSVKWCRSSQVRHQRLLKFDKLNNF